MKVSEFVRWLKSQGVKIENGKKHSKLYYNGRQTILPRHPAKELNQPLLEGVKKKLGLN